MAGQSRLHRWHADSAHQRAAQWTGKYVSCDEHGNIRTHSPASVEPNRMHTSTGWDVLRRAAGGRNRYLAERWSGYPEQAEHGDLRSRPVLRGRERSEFWRW